ncbi:MAG: GGDEF domain-containing response regulator [Terriglobia bacterium]
MKALIAEDDPISARLLQASLVKWGYDVVVTRDGVEALETLRQPDSARLAILDWMMPRMDGPDVIRELRKDQQGAYVYAILLTAKDRKEDLVRGLDMGADDYLVKPFDLHEMKARVRAGRRILELQEELVRAREALRDQATHDALTRVLNRAGILEFLDKELDRSRRDLAPIAVILADLDHFKRVNDNHGHLAGDEVLRQVSAHLRAEVRSYDAVGRYGGEEFLMVLPGCDAVIASRRAESLRVVIAGNPVAISENFKIPVSLSLGIATTAELGIMDAETLLRQADEALYRAKGMGRNRVVIAKAAGADFMNNLR